MVLELPEVPVVSLLGAGLADVHAGSDRADRRNPACG
jgi:hypothetical protein